MTATARDSGLHVAREAVEPSLEPYLETRSVVTCTGTRPTNPFGL